jgi:hypothetical protein
MSIYEQMHPWPPAQTALPVSGNQKRVLISYSMRTSGDSSDRKMTYAIFPDLLRGPAVYALHQHNNGPINVVAKSTSFWELCVSLSLPLLLSVAAWITPRIQRAT